MSLSAYYLMANSVTNLGCNGGNYYTLFNDIASGHVKTFETTDNYPYYIKQHYKPVAEKIP